LFFKHVFVCHQTEQDEPVLSLLSGLKNSIAFTTVLPVGMDTDGIAQAASYMPIFPLIGAGVGLAVGVVIWTLELILPHLVAGMVGLGCLILINGAQHTDGLLDFGDGLMYHGSAKEKLRIMRDPTTGAGGFSTGLIILSATAFSIAALPQNMVVPIVVASESAANFSMVLATGISKSAHKGLNTVFVEAMRSRRLLRLILSVMLFVVISLFALGMIGLAVTVGAILTGAGMAALSRRQFGGITGDVMGATNEISRLVSLLIILVFLK
jgi:adenosylcobinamide-GDP ribazoletransferase